MDNSHRNGEMNTGQCLHRAKRRPKVSGYPSKVGVEGIARDKVISAFRIPFVNEIGGYLIDVCEENAYNRKYMVP